MEQLTYILQFNDEVLYPSKNLKTIWQVMYNRCSREHVQVPDSYAVVRRRVLADGKYIHNSNPGWIYKIVQRNLLKKTAQLRMPLNQYQAELQKSDLTKVG